MEKNSKDSVLLPFLKTTIIIIIIIYYIESESNNTHMRRLWSSCETLYTSVDQHFTINYNNNNNNDQY